MPITWRDILIIIHDKPAEWLNKPVIIYCTESGAVEKVPALFELEQNENELKRGDLILEIDA